MSTQRLPFPCLGKLLQQITVYNHFWIDWCWEY
jgi:hypothetical protein